MAAPSTDDDIISGINVTPLVDVILVVLVIFVVTAKILLRSTVPVELPAAATAEQSTASLLALVLTRDGDLFIDGRQGKLADIGAAVAAARGRLGPERPPSAIVSADVTSRYGDFAAIIDELRLAGVSDIALDSQPGAARAGKLR